MNTKRSMIHKYVVFTLALITALMMALVGWRIVDDWASAAPPEYPDPIATDSGDNSIPEIDPTPDVEEPQPTQSEPPQVRTDEDAIRAALAAHFEMDESEFYRFEVNENNGTHAKGGVDNGYFLVAKVEGQWVFVAGGHSAPNCNKVANFGFPASMVPWCPAAGSNMPDCPGVGTTVATFITDVTIEDGSVLEPGEWFTKTWRIQNLGSCTWNPAYQLAFVSGDRMEGPLLQPLVNSDVPPGASVDVSLNLQAPDESGIYRGYWRFRSQAGEPFGLTTGGSIWVDIKVTGGSSGEGSSEDYSGYPFIEILKVAKDQTVTIKGLNFPAQDQFNVAMNYYGTNGVNGIYVASVLTGEGGEFTDTFQIPAALQGQATLAIRLESPYSGYYAYNWFGNY